MEEIGQEEVETAMHNMTKRQGDRADEVRLEIIEMAGEVGVKWTGRLLNVCMQERRIPKECMENEPDSADMEEEMGCARIRKVQGHHTTEPSTETVGEGFRRKDLEKSRRLLRGRTAMVQEGERSSRRDVRPETDGREGIGDTGQYGSGVRRPEESV